MNDLLTRRVNDLLTLILNALNDGVSGRAENAEIVDGEVLVTFEGTDYAISAEAL